MTPRSRAQPWWMLGPTLVLLVTFLIVPIGVAAFESFFAWDLLTPPRFVGAANYGAIAARMASPFTSQPSLRTSSKRRRTSPSVS